MPTAHQKNSKPIRRLIHAAIAIAVFLVFTTVLNYTRGVHRRRHEKEDHDAEYAKELGQHHVIGGALSKSDFELIADKNNQQDRGCDDFCGSNGFGLKAGGGGEEHCRCVCMQGFKGDRCDEIDEAHIPED